MTLPKAFANGSSVNKNFSKTQQSKMTQLGGSMSGLLDLFPSLKMMNSVVNLNEKELQIIIFNREIL